MQVTTHVTKICRLVMLIKTTPISSEIMKNTTDELEG
jgi:hypothetical protein